MVCSFGYLFGLGAHLESWTYIAGSVTLRVVHLPEIVATLNSIAQHFRVLYDRELCRLTDL